MTIGRALLNVILFVVTILAAWSAWPDPDLHVVAFDGCGLHQNQRLTNTTTTNNICEYCGTVELRDYKVCNVIELSWQCLYDPTLSVLCTAQPCSVSVPLGESPCVCQPPSQGCPSGQTWNFSTCRCEVEEEEGDPLECEESCEGSPIVLTDRGNRLRLTGLDDPVLFDINGDGVKERMGWTSPDDPAPFLALDRNGNGIVDDGTELFGNFTVQPQSDNPNGFAALALFDVGTNGGDEDGWITAKDAVFGSLLLWIDSNHDGTSQASELEAVTDSSLAGISLRYSESRRIDQHGNRFRFVAKARMSEGNRPRVRLAVDVFFVVEAP